MKPGDSLRSVIRWEDPPKNPADPPPHKWDKVVRQLDDKPGSWALIEIGRDRGTHKAINAGTGVWRPQYTYQAERCYIDGVVHIYARRRPGMIEDCRDASEELLNTLKRRYEEDGLSIHDLVREYGARMGTMYKLLQKAGVTFKPPGGRPKRRPEEKR